MSFETLSSRLTTLQESNAQLQDLISRLEGLKFPPGSLPLDNEEGNVLGELNVEIQQMLTDQEEDFKSVQAEVYDLATGKPGGEAELQKVGLSQAVKRGMLELQTCQTTFRKALRIAKSKLEAAQRAERALLLGPDDNPESSISFSVPTPHRRKQNAELSKEEKTVAASTDVTLALRRTHNMMVTELSRSQFALDTLNESKAALAQLSENYSTLETMLSRSRNLLGTLLRSQKSDTWYLETAFYVLVATIGWLVWRRFLYGPIWWLVWLPIKIILKACIGIFAALGVSGGEKGSGGVTSVSAITSSSLTSSATVSHRSGTRARGSVPSFKPPSVNVGGGGRGAPMGAVSGSPNIVTERVEKIIDESQEDQYSSGEETAQDEAEVSKPNPKKRMWEEDKEAAKEEQREKDEL
ncbi:hypothetical protein B7494_g1180 [Chlorociboria aeruginascens]|nr:hypothetical protein B7494_g1180 [Chlorociboria aeruginascens]